MRWWGGAPAPSVAWGGDGSWLDGDVEDVVAAYVDHRETCECGTRKAEWGSYVDGVFVEHEHPPYVAKSTTDPGCAAIDRKRESDAKSFGGKLPPGYRVVLVPNE